MLKYVGLVNGVLRVTGHWHLLNPVAGRGVGERREMERGKGPCGTPSPHPVPSSLLLILIFPFPPTCSFFSCLLFGRLFSSLPFHCLCILLLFSFAFFSLSFPRALDLIFAFTLPTCAAVMPCPSSAPCHSLPSNLAVYLETG